MPLEEVESLILANFPDARARFVFPSSVAADHWLKESLCLGLARALPTERFLSWDRFKEAVVAQDLPGKRPAGSELRIVFAADALSRNAAQPYLKALVPPEHRESWRAFAPALAAALPATARLGEGRPGQAPIVEDYLRLRSAYAAFLSARGFYEPNWEKKRYSPLGLRWIIFFPELIDDFPEYEGLLASRPESEIIILRDCPPKSGSLRLHGSLIGELRRALAEIGQALDSGAAEASDIAVTVPGFSGLRPFIEREAALYGIPADFRSGDSLADYPAGRFFSLMARAAGSGLAFEDLRDLLLSGGIPWKDPAAARSLVQFGLRYTVLTGWKEKGRDVDPWLATFRGRGPEWEPAERLYRGLKAQLSAFLKADGFAAVKAAWLTLSHSLLDPEAFPEELDRIFARCAASLDALAQAQRDAMVASVPGAFLLFLECLRLERYVPRSVPGGVRFYDYRVSAGIRPKLHYVLNAGQKPLTVLSGGCPFLREDIRAGLCLDESDSSEAFIRRYAQSGRSVFFSCSSAGLDGAQIAHGYFLDRAAGGAEGPALCDPESEERDFWSGKSAFPARVSDLRRAALGAAGETFLLPKGADFSERPSPGRGAESLAALKSLNATGLSAYRDCPFSWYFRSRLGAWTEASGIASFDARFAGIALHSSLEALYGAMAEMGPLSAGRIAEYRGLAPGALAESVRRAEFGSGMFAGVVLDSGGDKIVSTMLDMVGKDCEFFDGFPVRGAETELSAEDCGIGLPLSGRIDRLMDGPGGAWIIDYKSGAAKSQKAYRPDADNFDFQFPAYAVLVKANGGKLGGALLYEGKTRKYMAIAADSLPPVCGGQRAPVMGLAEFDAAGERFVRAAKDILAAIASGDFTAADPRERRLSGVCANCRSRPVCRSHYQVR